VCAFRGRGCGVRTSSLLHSPFSEVSLAHNLCLPFSFADFIVVPIALGISPLSPSNTGPQIERARYLYPGSARGSTFRTLFRERVPYSRQVRLSVSCTTVSRIGTSKLDVSLFSCADSHDAFVKSSGACRIHMRDTRMHGLQLRFHCPSSSFIRIGSLFVFSSRVWRREVSRCLQKVSETGVESCTTASLLHLTKSFPPSRTMLTFVLRRGYTNSVINRQYILLELLDVACTKYSQVGKVESGLTTISLVRWRIANHQRPRSYRDYYPTVYF
jgi:hypothetical protein